MDTNEDLQLKPINVKRALYVKTGDNECKNNTCTTNLGDFHENMDSEILNKTNTSTEPLITLYFPNIAAIVEICA